MLSVTAAGFSKSATILETNESSAASHGRVSADSREVENENESPAAVRKKTIPRATRNLFREVIVTDNHSMGIRGSKRESEPQKKRLRSD